METVVRPSASHDLLGSFPRLSNPGQLSSDALNRAYQHVSKHWLPVKQDVLGLVVERLEARDYDMNDECCLLSDLKQDFALYLYVLKEISDLPFSPINEAQHPAEMLASCSCEQLLTIVRGIRSNPPEHSFPWAVDNMDQRRDRVTTGAVCAEIVAERWNLDSEVAFLSAILRQLGIMLIRWNYPHISRRAVKKVSDSWNLDKCLEQLLGFSPVMLGIKFALECGFSRTVFYSFYGTNLPTEIEVVVPEEDGYDDRAEAYLTICEISDALVRSGEPESYPVVQMYWEELQKTLVDELGVGLFDELRQRAKTETALELHAKHLPSEEYGVPVKADALNVGVYIRENRHLKNCPLELRDSLLELYAHMRPGNVSHRCLSSLVRNVIPAAGFDFGCIFTLNPDARVLHPMVVIGNPPASLLKAVPLTQGSEISDSVASAFSCNLPYRDVVETGDSSAHTLFTAVVGTTRKVGVLALQAHTTVENEEEVFASFKALRHALNDFLNV